MENYREKLAKLIWIRRFGQIFGSWRNTDRCQRHGSPKLQWDLRVEDHGGTSSRLRPRKIYQKFEARRRSAHRFELAWTRCRSCYKRDSSKKVKLAPQSYPFFILQSVQESCRRRIAWREAPQWAFAAWWNLLGRDMLEPFFVEEVGGLLVG